MADHRIAPASAGADNGDALDVVWLRRCNGITARRVRVQPLARRLTATVSLGFFLTLSSAQTAFAPAAAAHSAEEAPLAMRLIAPIGIPLPDLAITLPTIGRPGSSNESGPGLAEPAQAARPAAESQAEAAAPSPEGDPEERLAFGPMRIKRWIVETVVRAAEATSVDPVYLMALADKESSFLPDNRARTSSAEGLFQFVEKTWLEVVRDFGPRHGLAAEAALIKSAAGHLSVEDDAARERVLGLRRDPYLSAVMAAEMKKRDRAQVARRIGRDLNRPELYLAHFMGAQGAARMLEALSAKPKQRASQVFPKAAKSNPTIFFSREGRRARGLTVAEVYERIDRMIDTRLDRYEGVTSLAKPINVSGTILP